VVWSGGDAARGGRRQARNGSVRKEGVDYRKLSCDLPPQLRITEYILVIKWV
jgi:hypothetical protein